MNEQEIDTEIAAVGVSMKTLAGSGKDGTEIAIQTHFPLDLSCEEMDAHLDKLADLLERQRVIGELPAIIDSIAKHEKSIEDILSDVDRLDKQSQKDWEKGGRSGTVKLSVSNQKHREETSITLKRWRDMLEIEKSKLAIALETRGVSEVQKPKVAKTA